MEKCPITGLKIVHEDSRSYHIKYDNETEIIKYGLRFEVLLDSDIFKKNRHIIAGAILNRQFNGVTDARDDCFLLTVDSLPKWLNEIIYPKTPSDKLDNLFRALYTLQQYDGEEIDFTSFLNNQIFHYKHYFRSKKECYFYISCLHRLGYIRLTLDTLRNPVEYSVSLEGLNYYIKSSTAGASSKKCFVAMSFGPNLKDIRQAIKGALSDTGYEPVLIDEQHIEPDKTINDAIIAGIRKAKFCVSDFTEQKHGVYFEAGFALGLGKPVIYCCKKEDFKDTHFDTKHFAHIIYENSTELKTMLIDKINAWIK